MSKDQVYTAIILKKTPLNEADEIITFYTQELGKVRGVAKSVKLQKSKLQHALQGLFLVKVVFAEKRKSEFQSYLKKIIHCEVVDSFANTREVLSAAKAGLFASETIFRATPDEQKNLEIFRLLKNFLTFLNYKSLSEDTIKVALVKFKLLLLKHLGHEVVLPLQSERVLFFSNIFGGFGFDLNQADRVRVSPDALELAYMLLSAEINTINVKIKGVNLLSDLLDNFLEYQIERKITAKAL